MSLILSLAVALALAPGAGAEETLLQWKLAEGDEFHYQVVRDAWSTQKLPEQMAAMTGTDEMTVGSRTETITRYVVDSVDDEGVAHVVATLLSAKIDSDQGPMGGKVKWDSTAEGATRPSNPVALVVAAPLGRETSFRLSPAGEVSDVEGFDEAVAAALETIQENPFMAMMAGQLKASGGNSAMEQLLSMQFGQVPEAPIETGGAWEKSNSSSFGTSGIGIVSTRTYSLTELSGGEDDAGVLAMLDIAIAVVQDDSAGTASGNPMAAMMKAKLEEAEGRGQAIFDVSAGRLVSSNTETDLKVTATMGPQMQIDADARDALQVEMLAEAPDLPPPPVITGEDEAEDPPKSEDEERDDAPEGDEESEEDDSNG